MRLGRYRLHNKRCRFSKTRPMRQRTGQSHDAFWTDVGTRLQDKTEVGEDVEVGFAKALRV